MLLNPHEVQTSIPLMKFGKAYAQVSALGMGGHHLGDAEDLKTATRIVDEAIDGGVTFFDHCWEYHRRNRKIGWADPSKASAAKFSS